MFISSKQFLHRKVFYQCDIIEENKEFFYLIYRLILYHINITLSQIEILEKKICYI